MLVVPTVPIVCPSLTSSPTTTNSVDNKFAYTVSILKGTSFFVLCPYGCKCGADQNEDTVDEVKDDEDDNGNTWCAQSC